MQTLRVGRTRQILAALAAAIAATFAIGLSIQAAQSAPAPTEFHAELDTSPR